MQKTPRPIRVISRRETLRGLAAAGAGLALAACSPRTAVPPVPAENSAPDQPVQEEVPQAQETAPDQPAVSISTAAEDTPSAEPAQEEPAQKDTPQPQSGQAYLAAGHGEDPAAITEGAIRALGGMERFVKSGFDVIIKPNICTDYYSFEYAATTNPVVVATLVRLALAAGAKRVRVMDFPFGGTAESAYKRSGIEEAVTAAGGQMELMNVNKFRKTKIPQGVSIQEWPIYQEALSCDFLINVPIAKHHGLAGLTLGGKNLLGVIQNRSNIHADFGQRIADLISVVRPGLTVVDAVRTLMRNGPTGGSLDDVKQTNTVIASHDIVAADSYATGLFGKTGADIAYIRTAAEMGLGTLDLSAIKVEEVNL